MLVRGRLLEKGLDDVPVIHGRLTGAEAVYANRQTQKGYVPATLARKQGSGPSWVTLLTAEQLRTMDVSEGRPNVYVLAKLRDIQFAMGKYRVVPLYSYVDVRGGVMTINGESVSLRSAKQKRAKSLLGAAKSDDAATRLCFDVIPKLDPPNEFCQLLRT